MSSMIEAPLVLRPGSRAVYRGRIGTVIGEPSRSSSGPIWHLVYDQPQPSGHPCGCCIRKGPGGHRYQGVFTTARTLTVVATL